MNTDSITWATTHGDRVDVYESITWWDGPAAVWGWRYRVIARNGCIVEQGSESYTRRRAAVKAALRHHPRIEAGQ